MRCSSDMVENGSVGKDIAHRTYLTYRQMFETELQLAENQEHGM